MASGFQEISPLTHPRISFTTITTPQSFRVNLNDATNQIDFIFALNDDPPLASDSVSLDRSAPPDSISDDDDGFRTPTSSDHKIPVVQQCPPAPTRPKPISCSRTLPRTSGVRRGFRVYISDEIADSIFCSDLLHQKTKKARKNGNGGEWNEIVSFSLLINQLSISPVRKIIRRSKTPTNRRPGTNKIHEYLWSSTFSFWCISA